MNVWRQIEESICSLEELLDIKVTIIDNEGILRDQDGNMLFPPQRQSHKKNKICELGFCRNCIQHCRYEMNAKGEQLKNYFFSHCWKGVREVVVPIYRKEIHFGLLYAGIWREPGQMLPDNSELLPDQAGAAYSELPPFDYEHGKKLGEILNIFVQGIVVALYQMKPFDEYEPGRKMLIWQYIVKNALHHVSVKELGARLYLSPSRTSHLVKKLFGESFQELVIKERINQAKKLLTNSENMVKEVAEKVGIHDEYYFNKIFKKRVGLPPGKFRTMNREKS